jgi:hypothetical protein
VIPAGLRIAVGTGEPLCYVVPAWQLTITQLGEKVSAQPSASPRFGVPRRPAQLP